MRKPVLWAEKHGGSYDTFVWEGPEAVTIYNMVVDKTTGKGFAHTKEFGEIACLPRVVQLSFGPTVSPWNIARGVM